MVDLSGAGDIAAIVFKIERLVLTEFLVCSI
jgi:hypothetical protein